MCIVYNYKYRFSMPFKINLIKFKLEYNPHAKCDVNVNTTHPDCLL